MERSNILRHNRIILSLRRLHRLLPPSSAQTPFTTRVQPGDLTQVVAAGGGEVEEFFGYNGCTGRESVSSDPAGMREKKGRGGGGPGDLPATAWFPPSSAPTLQ